MLCPKMLPVSALALLCYLSSTQAVEPMLQVHVNSVGLHNVGEVGVEYFSEIFPGMSVSSLEGNYSCPPVGLVCIGKVKWYVRDVTFYEINLPTTTVVTDPDAEHFRWSVNNASFIARGYLNYTYYLIPGLLVVSNSEPFNLSVSGVDITVNVTVTKNFLGLPRVDVVGCKCVIHSTTVHFRTLILGVVYNLFNQAIANDLKEALQVKICEGAMETVDTHGNEVLSTTSLDIPQKNGIKYGCKLRDNPSLLTGLVQAPIVCQLSVPGYDPVSFSPLPMPAITLPNKMIATAVSVDLFNLNNVQLFNANLFDFVFDDSNTQPDTFLKTTDCPTGVTCIGTLFPEIAANFTGWKIVIEFGLVEPRQAFMSATGFTVRGKHAGEIKAINQTSEEIVSLYNFTFTTNRYAIFTMIGLDFQQQTTGRDYSSIEFMPAFEDETGRMTLLSFLLLHQGIVLSANVGSSWTLPKVHGMSWINPEITHMDGAILFSADVAFIPF